MMRRFLMVAVVLCLAAPAAAQYRVEVSGNVGWTFSDGVPFDTGVPVNGFIYDRVDPKDSVNFGFTFGLYVTPQAEVEFLWNRQPTTLEVRGTGPVLSGDMNVDNYHVNFVYNFGDEETMVRPFVFAGLGATSYGDAAFPTRTVPGVTKFSWGLGAGVKAFANRNVGFKGTVRWNPTYIKTDEAGWWCDPYWGCYVVGDADYANQFEFTGGVVLRF
jgi:opacity protein-like surface antigen